MAWQPLEQETSFSETADDDNKESVVEGEEEEDGDQRIYLHIYDYETDAFSSVTTYHGMVRIYNARTWPSRIFWIVTVLCWLSMFVLHSGRLLWSYNQHSTEVTITTIVPEKGIQFPAVTACNLNPVARSKVAAWNMSDAVLNYLLKSHPEVGQLEPFATTGRGLAREHDEYLTYIAEYKAKTGRDFELGAFFSETGHTCEDMVLSCKWAGRKIQNCCDFAVPIMTDLGKCMMFSNFNTSEVGQRQKISGASYGFHMLMDIKTAERHDVIQQNYVDAGIRLFVHPENAIPYLHTSGVAAAPGTKVYTSVTLKNISLLSTEEWGSCLNKWDEDVHGKVLVGRNYSSAHCEANCVANIYWNKCNCVPLSKQFNSHMRVCTPFELHNCTHSDYLRVIQREIADDIYSNCGCRIECNRLEYKTASQYSAITTAYQHLHSRFGVSRNYVRENFVAADVFMSDIVYEEQTQSAQSKRVEVLSKIGGSIGLFLGVSVITLFEIFIYLFKSAWGAVSGDRQKRFEHKERNIFEKELVALEKRILPPDDISVIVESVGDDEPFTEQRPSRRLARRASETPRVPRRASQAVPYTERPRTASDVHEERTHDNNLYMEQPSTSKQSDPFEDVQFAIENHRPDTPTPAITIHQPLEREVQKAKTGEKVPTVLRVRSNEDTEGNPIRRPSRLLLRRVSTTRAHVSPARRQSLRKFVLQQGRARHLSEHETAASSSTTGAAADEPESMQQRRQSTAVVLRQGSTTARTRHLSERGATEGMEGAASGRQASNQSTAFVPRPGIATARTRHLSERGATEGMEGATSGRKASSQSTQSAHSTVSKNSDIVLTIVDHRRPSMSAWSRNEQIHHLRRPLRPLLRRPARTMVVERRPSQAVLPTIVVRTEESDDDERRDSQMSSQLHRSASVGRRPSRTPSATGSTTSSYHASNKDIHLAVVSENRRLSVAPTGVGMFRRPSRGQLLLRRPSRTVVIEQRRQSIRPAAAPITVNDGNPIQQQPQKAERRPSNIHFAVVHDQGRSSAARAGRPVASARSPSKLATEPRPGTSAQLETVSDVEPLCKDDDD